MSTPQCKKVSSHIQASVMGKIEGFCKNNFSPSTGRSRKRQKLTPIVQKKFSPHRQATGLMLFCIGFENFCKKIRSLKGTDII